MEQPPGFQTHKQPQRTLAQLRFLSKSDPECNEKCLIVGKKTPEGASEETSSLCSVELSDTLKMI